MIIKHPKSLRTKIILSIVGVLIAICILSAGLYALTGSLFGWKPFDKNSIINTTGNNPASQEQINAGTSVKQSSLQSGKNSGSDQPPAPVPQTNGTKSIVQISITSAIQTSASLQVGTQIAGVFSTGTCTLTLSKQGEQDIVKTAGVQPLASTSTCKGFDITDKLTPGVWNLSLVYESDNLTGTASTTKVIQ